MSDFRPLKPHQEDMIKYGLKSKHTAFLVEMRLGKTLTWVRLQQYRETKNNLVVAPINVMDSWEKELSLEGERYFSIYGTSKEKRLAAIKKSFLLNRRTWILINYESLRATPHLAYLKWDSAVLDESVKIKNPHAQITKLCMEGFRDTSHRGILTGLIAPETLLNIYPQFHFLHGQFMDCRSYWSFRIKYFEPFGEDGYEWFPKKGMREQIKSIMHSKAFVLRRQDAGFFTDKIYASRTVDMNSKQIKLYKQVKENFEYDLHTSYSTLDDPIVIETIWATEKYLWLCRVAGGFTPDGKECISTSIPDEILYLLQNDFVDQPVVIYYRFQAELEHDFDYLGSRGISVTKMKGLPMNLKTRRENEARWKAGQFRVLLCMQDIATHGKDFSRSSVVIYRSQYASCDKRVQSEDRTVLMDKLEPQFYVDIFSRDTVNEALVETVRGKAWDAREFLTNFKHHLTWINEGKQRSLDLDLEVA